MGFDTSQSQVLAKGTYHSPKCMRLNTMSEENITLLKLK
jgi:hypothetical protein